jgi:TPR repeat protein
MYELGRGVPQDYVEAHKWFNLAAAISTTESNRNTAVKGRDRVATRMTPDQIAEAQKLAREWRKQ